MRAGTILRTVGCIVFLAGLVGCVFIVIGSQSLITAYSGDIIGAGNLVTYSWVAAICVLVSSGFTACLIFTIGSISNNIAEINIKMEDVQSSTLESAKALRYIAYVLDKRLVKDASNNESAAAEQSAQYGTRSYMRSRSNSTQA